MRSLFASGFPIFAKSMYSYLGMPWAMTFLALCAVALAQVPVLFYYFGGSIRAKSKWKPAWLECRATVRYDPALLNHLGSRGERPENGASVSGVRVRRKHRARWISKVVDSVEATSHAVC